jgi:monoterpene epsilon-lactone hydrolase
MITEGSKIRDGAAIHHPIHLLDRVAMVAMRLMVGSMKGSSLTGPSSRGQFDELMEKTPAADGVTYEEAEVGGVAGWWCRPDDAVAGAAVLYFHGGAYVVGSARAYQHFVGQVAARANVCAFVPEYGLAPEHPFPAAVDEALACYKGLVEKGFGKIALAGDSAGGGLALVLLSVLVAKARDLSALRPAGAAVMSPWTDLALSGTSMETRAEADPLLTKSRSLPRRNSTSAGTTRATHLRRLCMVIWPGCRRLECTWVKTRFSSTIRFATASVSKAKAGPSRSIRGRA